MALGFSNKGNFPDLLHLPRKFQVNDPVGNFSQNMSPRVGLDNPELQTLIDGIQTAFDRWSDDNRQNWLELERWVQRYQFGAAATFIVVDAAGSGDYTSIKSAIEAQPAGNTTQGWTIIYVKTSSSTYGDSGAGRIALPDASKILVWCGAPFTSDYGLSSNSLPFQLWTHDGFTTPNTSNNTYIALHGLQMTISSNTPWFTVPSGNGGLFAHMTNCRLTTGSLVDAMNSSSSNLMTFYFQSCTIGTTIFGTASTFGYQMFFEDCIINSLFGSSITIGTTGGFSGGFRQLYIGNSTITMPSSNTLTFACSPNNTSGFSGSRVELINNIISEASGSITFDDIQAVRIEGNRANTANSSTITPTWTFRAEISGLTYQHIVTDNILPGLTLDFEGTEASYQVVSGSYRKIIQALSNANFCVRLDLLAASSATALTVSGNDNVFVVDFHNGSGSSNTAVSDSGSRNRYLTAGESGFGTSGVPNNPVVSSAITGTTTNNNAAAGVVGEIISSVVASGSAVSLTTATPANITSISLTAGDWDVTGVIDYVLTGATASDFKSGSSSTSATFGAQDTFTNVPLITTLLSDTFGQILPVTRFSLASTTTVYLVAQAAFTVGTVAAYGTIRARRVR